MEEMLRDMGSIPGSGRSPRGGHGNPLQYSCLENPMDRGAWWVTVHRVTKIWAWLKWLNAHAHILDTAASAAAKSHQSVRLCATPETAAHQAPPSLGFSRQEPWSGLPFPSPLHESEKWKWSRSVVSDHILIFLDAEAQKQVRRSSSSWDTCHLMDERYTNKCLEVK